MRSARSRRGCIADVDAPSIWWGNEVYKRTADWLGIPYMRKRVHSRLVQSADATTQSRRKKALARRPGHDLQW